MINHPFVEKILSSKTFANKEVLKGLLRFLYEKYKDGVVLREADIAVGYFKRGSDFVPGEDTIVRVTIYKLRALLEKYYADEGKLDADVIEIPKGSYVISIKGKTKAATKALEPVSKITVSLLLLLLVLSVVANMLLWNKGRVEKPENPVWSSYIKANQPAYITLGDPFFFRVKDESAGTGSLIVRDITINSQEDLSVGLRNVQKHKSEIVELNYPYFSRNNLWPLPDIISFFAKANVETRLQTLSESNIDDVKNNNVIFIANINSFRWMNRFLDRTSLRISNNPRQIKIYQQRDSLVLSVPEIIKGGYVDYAILVKLPGPNNNQITMLGDFHASGLRGLSHLISTKSSVKELEREIRSKHGKFPDYFEMVVKVTSYNYSDFNTELIHFKELSVE